MRGRHRPDATLVVFHSAVLAYVADAGLREAFGRTVRALGAVWVSNEVPGALPSIRERLSRPGPRGAFLLSVDGVAGGMDRPARRLDRMDRAEEGCGMKLAGQVALVTGGSRGIGRATALAFAAEGADIAFCHLDDGREGARRPRTRSARWAGARCTDRSMWSISPPAARSRRRSTAAFGPIDILFNNAGMNIRKRFEDYTEADYDRILDVHMKGMFFMAQAVYPAMVARGRGCIINVASQRGLKGAVNSTPYCAAKAAIIGFTRALACEAAPKGVRVNAIAPGPIVTDLTATMAPADRQAFIDALPVHRFGRPEEIAATALLLAGPDGGFYVGATLSPNGGDVMY